MEFALGSCFARLPVHFRKVLALFIKETVSIHQATNYSFILAFLSLSFDFHQWRLVLPLSVPALISVQADKKGKVSTMKQRGGRFQFGVQLNLIHFFGPTLKTSILTIRCRFKLFVCNLIREKYQGWDLKGLMCLCLYYIWITVRLII